MTYLPPAGRRTQQKREEEQVESKDIYNKVWTNREDAQNRNIHIIHRQDYNIIF